MINFKKISKEEIGIFFEDLGQPQYRARQTVHWIYEKLAHSFDDMTSLPRELRSSLKEQAILSNIQIKNVLTSPDGTKKFLFQLEDGETVESVLIPNDAREGRYTLCISSQVGCPLACTFCMTGRMRFRRNLHDYEIVDQVIAVKRFMTNNDQDSSLRRSLSKKINVPSTISNLVLMGMGEPLLNFDNLTMALWKFVELMGFSKRKITVSTAGIVAGMNRLGSEGPGINLAVSLNATTETQRTRIMPVNRMYSLKDVVRACRAYPLAPGRRITFEYILLDLINDSLQDARRLVKLLIGIPCKINLIPYNPSGGSHHDSLIDYRRPGEKKVMAFQNVLHDSGLTAIIRKSRGADISAACGQLKASYEALY